MSTSPIIAVTIGDPAGVGPSLVIFGDSKVLSQLSAEADLPMPCVAETLAEAVTLFYRGGELHWTAELCGEATT